MDPNDKGSEAVSAPACMTRREFARATAFATAALGSGVGALLPARARAEDEVLITEIAANAAIITSLEYVNESPKPDQHCVTCVLYTGPAEGRGKCALFQQGVVAAKGWCRSYAPKPPTP